MCIHKFRKQQKNWWEDWKGIFTDSSCSIRGKHGNKNNQETKENPQEETNSSITSPAPPVSYPPPTVTHFSKISWTVLGPHANQELKKNEEQEVETTVTCRQLIHPASAEVKSCETQLTNRHFSSFNKTNK